MKIAFVQIHYPLTMGRYMLEALRRMPDVEVWSAGPFSGAYIPWKGGMNLSPKFILQPDHPLPFSPSAQATANYDALQKAVPWKPDLWIEANSTLKTMGRPKEKYAVVGTDPHVLDYDAARSKADYFFCMQQPYKKESDIWLPYAYDPYYHAQTPLTWAERKTDVSLIGLQYENRNQFFSQVRASGYSAFYETGLVFADAREIYHNTKVGFNWSSLLDTTARVFEIMAFGIAPLLNRTPDLMQLFEEGRHFLGFDDLDEAIGQFEWLMSHPKEAETLAYEARLAVRSHTWEARMKQLMDRVLDND